MDSFYDVPRRAPVPTPVEKFLAAPVVPEVSMICPVKAPVNNFMPYHTWKMQQNSHENGNVLTSNRQNIIRGPAFNHFQTPQNTSQLFKKQVRFESPVLQQRPSLTYEPFNAKKGMPNDNPQVDQKVINVRGNEPPLSGKTFEELYMANVPTRQLDLSIIELPTNLKKSSKHPGVLEGEREEVHTNLNLNTDTQLETEINKNKENELPKTYRAFLETQKKIAKENKADANDSVIDIFNYKKNKNFIDGKNNLEGKEIMGEYEQSGAVSCKGILPKVSPEQIKEPDGCAYNYSNPVRMTDARKSQPQVCNRAQTVPVTSCNYTGNGDYRSYLLNRNNLPKLDTETQTTIVEVQPQRETPEKEQPRKGESEPTNKDLLKIIAQQNEQLLILQKQVAMLLNRDQKSQPKSIEAMPQPQRVNYMGENCVTSTQNENFRSPMKDGVTTPRKRGMSKFSIDLMTSFEVAIRPQHNKQNFVNCEPKIQEITESESVATAIGSDRNDKTVMDTSLHLQEPVRVREVCPSPEPSININMNDYDSSEDDEVTASEIGATFYRNLMGQVNNILKKAQVQTKEDLAARDDCKNVGISDKIRDKTMNRVKEATLKHLRSIGVTIGPMDDADDSLNDANGSKDYNATEVSFAVKQILMKYLPDDQLAKVTYKQAQGKSVPARKEESPGIIPARPEFSFASIQYMKKYNLLPNDTRPRDVEVPRSDAPRLDGPKILDITALKMQPKLL